MALLRPRTNGIATPKMQAFSGTPTYALEISKQETVYFLCKAEVHCIFIRNRDFYCIFKGFEEKLRLPYSCKATLEFDTPKMQAFSGTPHSKTTLISLGLFSLHLKAILTFRGLCDKIIEL